MNLLVALNVLLEEGSVVGAARRMHLSPPAMSRTLSRIREAVGDPIMVRAGRKLVPTPRALELQEQVRQLVDQARDLFNTRETIQLDKLGAASPCVPTTPWSAVWPPAYWKSSARKRHAVPCASPRNRT